MDEAARVAADFANTILEESQSWWWRSGVGDVPIPPIMKLSRGLLSVGRLICLEKVDNEFIEFLIVESIVMAHPMGSVAESEVQLQQ